MKIKRKRVCNKAGNPVSDWDIAIEKELHETIEENGDFVIEDRKRSICLILKNKELWQTGV